MTASTSNDAGEVQSFLRTGPESALHSEDHGFKEEVPARRRGDATIFPAPAISADVGQRLSVWKTFAGLAVRLDSFEGAEAGNALYAAVESCLETAMMEKAGLWFKWDHGLYGCALPAVETDEAATLGKRIQALMAEQRAETLSIGITRYPLLDYDSAASMQNACKALDHAAFFGPGSVVIFDAVSLNISGDHYYQAGRLEQALTEYRAALQLDPQDVNVLNSLGVCLAQRQDLGGARAAFAEAFRLDSEEAMAVFNLGMLDVLDHDDASALKRFLQAYTIDPDTHYEIPFQIGKLLTGQNAYEQAATYLTAAIKLRDTHAPAFCLLGQCLSALERPREAIQAYKKAVKLNPNDAAALSALGTLYDQRGENPEICLTFCRQSVTLCPDNGLFHWRLARLYQKQNRLEAALAEYQAAAALGHDAGRQIAEIQEQLETPNDKTQRCA